MYIFICDNDFQYLIQASTINLTAVRFEFVTETIEVFQTKPILLHLYRKPKEKKTRKSAITQDFPRL